MSPNLQNSNNPSFINYNGTFISTNSDFLVQRFVKFQVKNALTCHHRTPRNQNFLGTMPQPPKIAPISHLLPIMGNVYPQTVIFKFKICEIISQNAHIFHYRAPRNQNCLGSMLPTPLEQRLAFGQSCLLFRRFDYVPGQHFSFFSPLLRKTLSIHTRENVKIVQKSFNFLYFFSF